MERKPVQPLELYPLQHTVGARISDLDQYGHLNAIRIGHLYEDARAQFYRTAFGAGSGITFVVAQITIRYLREVRWPGDLRIGTGVISLGRSSFTTIQGLFDAQEGCAGVCETVTVIVDRGAAAPLGDRAREALQALAMPHADARLPS